MTSSGSRPSGGPMSVAPATRPARQPVFSGGLLFTVRLLMCDATGLRVAPGWMESGGQNAVVPPTGAVGIGQAGAGAVRFVTTTLLHKRLSARVAADNGRMSARFLRYLLDHGDVPTAVGAYSQG